MKFASPILVLGLILSFSGMGFGQQPDPAGAQPDSWTGTLADAACKAATPEAACSVSSSTQSYGIVSGDGKFMPFDASSNQKVNAELKDATGNPGIEVKGEMQGNELKVTEIRLAR